MDLKLCSKCKRLLSVSSFNWKIQKVKLSYHCKECSRAYVKEHYIKNRMYYLNKAKKRNTVIKNIACEYIAKYLKGHPCVDCGEKDILVLEFDHKNRAIKSNEVSSIIRGFSSVEKVMEEVAKCDVRCANCHRRKTGRENNSWKLKYAPVA